LDFVASMASSTSFTGGRFLYSFRNVRQRMVPSSRSKKRGGPGDLVDGVVDTEGLDQVRVRIRQQREREAELAGQRFGVLERIDAERDELSAALAEGLELTLQLAELLAAVGSPVAAVEHQHGELSRTAPAAGGGDLAHRERALDGLAAKAKPHSLFDSEGQRS
jgi:hypothetical protein